MGYGNDMNSIVVMAEDNLKWELLHAAGTMPIVDPNETFGVGLDVGKRNVDGNTEIARGSGTAFRVPIRRCFQLGGCFGMKTNSHGQHRASRTIERGYPPNPQ